MTRLWSVVRGLLTKKMPLFFGPYEVGTDAHDKQELCCGIGAHNHNSGILKVIEKPCHG